MKKAGLFVCAAVTAALCLFTVPGCGAEGGYSETFKGYLSESTFYSRAAAARGFAAEQFNAQSGEYIGYTENGIVSTEEAEKLGIAGNASSVTVKYRSSALAEQSEATAYLVETANGYKYFAPLPKTGEPITASYYKSVVSGSAYDNCTVNTTYNMHLYSIDSSYMQIFAFDYDKAYFKQTLPIMQVDFFMEETNGGFTYYSKLPEMGEDRYYTEAEAKQYYRRIFYEGIDEALAEKGSGYYVDYQAAEREFEKYYEEYCKYVLIKGGKEYPLDSFGSISELSAFIYVAEFDNTYFEKTDYGFCMSRDKFMAAVNEIIGELGEVDDDAVLQLDEHLRNFNVKYYVKDGRLARTETVIQTLLSENIKDLFTLEVYSDFGSFGSTKITIPKGENS